MTCLSQIITFWIVFTLLMCSGIAAGETKTVPVGDIDMAYEVRGEGSPLLLIMGFSGTMDLWDPIMIQMLSSRYRVITFDNRGMGQTTTTGTDFTIEQMADDTAGLLAALGIPQTPVLAWSMGTNIAQELILRHPEKVKKLILYAADCGGEKRISPTQEVITTINKQYPSPREQGEALFKILFPEKWLKENPDPSTYFPFPKETSSEENIQRQSQAMMNWQGSYDRLPSIYQPTLLITGTDDVLTPPANSLLFVGRIPGVWLIQIEGGGHGLMYQFPKRFSEILLTFLEE
ncbi:MAG: alpha/beta hydrolase [Atribacterota bacterium]